jgi:hypothetical protein
MAVKTNFNWWGARMIVQGTSLALMLSSAQAADVLPTAWRTGIATNYGGAQDGMVSQEEPQSIKFKILWQLVKRLQPHLARYCTSVVATPGAPGN